MTASTARAGLVLLSVAVALAIGEIALRLLPVGSPTPVPDEELGHLHEPGLRRTLVDPESNRSVLLETNLWGFRDGAWTPGAGPAVMVVGDSLVDAMQVEKHERFTEILAHELARDGMPWHVLNMGVSGTGPETYIERVRKFVPLFSPEYVVVAVYNGNDLHNPNYDLTPGSARKAYVVRDGSVIAYRDVASSWEKLGWRAKTLLGQASLMRLVNDGWVKAHSAPQRLAVEEIAPRYCALSPQDLANSFLIFDTLLAEINELSGNRLVILDIPEISQFRRDLPEGCNPTLVESHLSDLSKERGIAVVPLFDRFSTLTETPYYSGHLAPLGHRIAAEALRDEISRIRRSVPPPG